MYKYCESPGGGGSGKKLSSESKDSFPSEARSSYRTPDSLNAGYGGRDEKPAVINNNVESA